MDLYRVNLNLLIALDVLLTECSVTRAAKTLFITQAAMSNNLQQLREVFKDELLMREKNYMVPTTYAKELQPKLHQVLQDMRSLIVTGHCFVPEKSTRVFKIAMSDYMTSLIGPALLARLREKAPGISLMIIPVNFLNSAEPFEQGEYDLGIGKVFGNVSAVKRSFLFDDTAVCIMSKKHPLAKKEKITMKEYLAAEHIAIRTDTIGFTSIIEESLRSLGYTRNIKIGLPYIGPIFKLVETSDYLVGTVIKRMALLYAKNHQYVMKPLPFKIPNIEFYLVWHQRYENDLGHAWLRQQISTLI